MSQLTLADIKSLSLGPNSVIQLPSGTSQEVAALVCKFLVEAGHPDTLVICADLNVLTEDQMREHGWVRAVPDELSGD